MTIASGRQKKKDVGQKLFIEFDGVFQEAEVFVNGKSVGTHVGGYTGFFFDISKEVRAGDNVIAVRVNNIWKADVAPRAGEHTFSGGIYRNVRLVKKMPVYIDWYGVFVSTPGLAAKNGKVSTVKIYTEYSQVPPPEWPAQGVPAQLKLDASRITDILTDGTDDVQLTVTVLNAEGKPVSNSPAVDLKCISGPGEFPTGKMIRFQPDSDIRIMDGQAAIAFRSYYAGTSIIEASSPGLKPARIEITFRGDVAYKKGVTPEVEERPYVRFKKENKEKAIQVFGRNNPTFASSQHEKQVAGLAADGNLNTYWQTSQDDPSPFLILDTEKELEIKDIRVEFPQESVYRYVIEVSGDRTKWDIVLDKQDNNRKESFAAKAFTDTSVRARFVRIRFKGKSPAAVADVVVKGVVCE